jgi:hypothetical protein
VCPFSAQQSFGCPTSLPRVTNNRSDRKSLSPVTNAQCTREQLSTKLSPGEYAHGSDNHSTTTNLSPRETAHGLSTRLFDNETLDYNPTTPYKLLCADKVIIGFSIQSDPLLLTRACNMNNNAINNNPPKIH